MCDHCEPDITEEEAYAEMNRVAGDMKAKTKYVNELYQARLESMVVVNGHLEFPHGQEI